MTISIKHWGKDYEPAQLAIRVSELRADIRRYGESDDRVTELNAALEGLAEHGFIEVQGQAYTPDHMRAAFDALRGKLARSDSGLTGDEWARMTLLGRALPDSVAPARGADSPRQDGEHFADYLQLLDSVATVTADDFASDSDLADLLDCGRFSEFDLFMVDVADWEAWLTAQAPSDAGTADLATQLGQYRPSSELVYAVATDDHEVWGSGATAGEAVADALP